MANEKQCVSRIKLIDGTTVDIKDSEARSKLTNLVNDVQEISDNQDGFVLKTDLANQSLSSFINDGNGDSAFATVRDVSEMISVLLNKKEDDLLAVSSFSGVYPTTVESITWFDSSNIQTEYLITSADMLAEFAFLVNQGYSFTNVVFKLDTDISWNPYLFDIDIETGTPFYNGKVIDEDNQPYLWTVIGERWNASAHNVITSGKHIFDGNFDGQGHSISGLYINDTEHMGGLFSCFKGNYIKNLSITNSYFATGGYTGTFVGFIDNDNEANGDIELNNLYSSAYFYITPTYSYHTRSAGIAGMIRNIGDLTVDKCWYDGKLVLSGSSSSSNYAGGLFAVICKDGETDEIVSINNCLMTGEIYIVNNLSPSYLGGLVGDFYCSLDSRISNSLVAIRNTNVMTGHNGVAVKALVGYLENNEVLSHNVLTTTNCYYVPINGFNVGNTAIAHRIIPYAIVNGIEYTGETTSTRLSVSSEIATSVDSVELADLDNTLFELDSDVSAKLIGLRNVNNITPTPVTLIGFIEKQTLGDLYIVEHKDGTKEKVLLSHDTDLAGLAGKDGTTPILRINPNNAMWEVSYDSGKTYLTLDCCAKGEDGYTPQKGIDYFTDSEIEKFKNDIIASLSYWEASKY